MRTCCTYLCIACMCVHFICIHVHISIMLYYLWEGYTGNGFFVWYTKTIARGVLKSIHSLCFLPNQVSHPEISGYIHILHTYVSRWSLMLPLIRIHCYIRMYMHLQYRVCQPAVSYVCTYCCVQESRIKDYKQHLDEIVKIFYSTCKSVDSSLMLLLQPHAAKVMR